MNKWITCKFDDNELLIDAESVIAMYKDIDKMILDIYLKGANKNFSINYQSVEELNKSYDELFTILKKY